MASQAVICECIALPGKTFTIKTWQNDGEEIVKIPYTPQKAKKTVCFMVKLFQQDAIHPKKGDAGILDLVFEKNTEKLDINQYN